VLATFVEADDIPGKYETTIGIAPFPGKKEIVFFWLHNNHNIRKKDSHFWSPGLTLHIYRCSGDIFYAY